jgi:hypothetical protein
LDEDTPIADGALRRDARRAMLALDLFLRSATVRPPSDAAPLDLLDSEIRSLKTAERTFEEAAPEARRWRIATTLRSADFARALKAARETR